jgi:hypothetical protein
MSEEAKQIEAINKRLQAQKLEADRTGEIQQLQDAQRKESAKKQRAQMKRQASTTGTHPDLQDLNFGSIPSTRNQNLPPPMRPDSAQDDYASGYVPLFLYCRAKLSIKQAIGLFGRV